MGLKLRLKEGTSVAQYFSYEEGFSNLRTSLPDSHSFHSIMLPPYIYLTNTFMDPLTAQFLLVSKIFTCPSPAFFTVVN